MLIAEPFEIGSSSRLQTMLIAEPFEIGSSCRLVEDDNIIDGAELPRQLQQASARMKGANLFTDYVQGPERHGTLGFDEESKARTIVEKPSSPVSQYVMANIYFYDGLARHW